jgi:hypothetical protein
MPGFPAQIAGSPQNGGKQRRYKGLKTKTGGAPKRTARNVFL